MSTQSEHPQAAREFAENYIDRWCRPMGVGTGPILEQKLRREASYLAKDFTAAVRPLVEWVRESEHGPYCGRCPCDCGRDELLRRFGDGVTG